MRRTRLIATLGPATESAETIGALIEAGADTFRLNMSHACTPTYPGSSAASKPGLKKDSPSSSSQ